MRAHKAKPAPLSQNLNSILPAFRDYSATPKVAHLEFLRNSRHGVRAS